MFHRCQYAHQRLGAAVVGELPSTRGLSQGRRCKQGYLGDGATCHRLHSCYEVWSFEMDAVRLTCYFLGEVGEGFNGTLGGEDKTSVSTVEASSYSFRLEKIAHRS